MSSYLVHRSDNQDPVKKKRCQDNCEKDRNGNLSPTWWSLPGPSVFSSSTSVSSSSISSQNGRHKGPTPSSSEPATSISPNTTGIHSPSSFTSGAVTAPITTAQGPSPFPTTSSDAWSTTVPVLSTATPTSHSQQSSALVNHGLDGRKIAAILVPILVLLALLPILYICYLRRRSKRDRRALPELHFPQKTQLLESRPNSISLTSPFSDNERIRSNSLGMYDRPSTEVSRAPSPVLPSPSIPTFHVRESWPLSSSNALPDPPPAYNPHSSNLRPPSSTRSRVSSISRSSSFTGTDTTLQNPFTNRVSDSVSELSFDQGSRGRRTRDLDELSVVSAVESEGSEERNPRHLI